MSTGRCHCGAIRYMVDGTPLHHALCHCTDCRRHAGAPMVGWIAFPAERVTIEGNPVTYRSSETGRRRFCGTCGTGLFYENATFLPGIIDIQSCTLDDPEAVPPGAHIQVEDRLAWTHDLGTLPAFDHYPPMDEPASAA